MTSILQKKSNGKTTIRAINFTFIVL